MSMTTVTATERYKVPIILSVIVLVLIALASFAGLFFGDVYRDNTWASSQFRGADFIRLFIAIPLFAGAIYFTVRGSIRGMLICLGFLWLAVYDYAFYLFAAAFNELFLVYAAIFGLSILALIWALPRVDVEAIRGLFSERTPVKWVSGYMFVWVVFLGGLWIVQSVAFLFTGDVPQSIIDSGHPTGIVFALDLSVLLPAVLLAAIWLWQRRPWGYVLAVMVNVKGATYALALIAMGVFADRAGVEGAGGLMLLWVFFTVASLAAALALLLNMRASKEQPESVGEAIESSGPVAAKPR